MKRLTLGLTLFASLLLLTVPLAADPGQEAPAADTATAVAPAPAADAASQPAADCTAAASPLGASPDELLRVDRAGCCTPADNAACQSDCQGCASWRTSCLVYLNECYCFCFGC